MGRSESITIAVSPETDLSPGTLGHLKRRDDRPLPSMHHFNQKGE